MSVYGIGAYYEEDVSDQFITKGVCCIGYERGEASSLYEMLRRVKIGSVIYIKSFVRGTLYIKAIGRVTGKNIEKIGKLGFGREVDWIVPLHKDGRIELKLSAEDMKNNVYNNTLYEEYSVTVIDILWEKIKEF
jgi:hypothetical protein